jgi:hypothetical protein
MSNLKPFRETVPAHDGSGNEIEITMGYDGRELYVELRGQRIAKRGKGDRDWVPLVAGWRVTTSPDYARTVVECTGSATA